MQAIPHRGAARDATGPGPPCCRRGLGPAQKPQVAFATGGATGYNDAALTMSSAPESNRPVRKLLVANRSEIAIRVFRAASELGLRTVAIYAQEDRLSVHRFKADEAYLVGQGKGPVAAYLDIPGIVSLAREVGADLIHPGYGFLSENAGFAQACAEAGITFVGPKPALLDMMGDKTAARALAQKLNVPTLPGTPEPISDRAEALKVRPPDRISADHQGRVRRRRPRHARRAEARRPRQPPR